MPSRSASQFENSRETIQPDTRTPTSISVGTSRSSGRTYRSLVEDPLYRIRNLAANNIYLRSRRDTFPEAISRLLQQMGEARSSPGPTVDSIVQDADLEALQAGTSEASVEHYWKNRIFPSMNTSEKLQRADRLPMSKSILPYSIDSNYKLSTPQPDILYGYNHANAFSQAQRVQLLSMGDEGLANSLGLLYPFFVVEFKSDGPTGAGSMWVATNQCLVGTPSCVSLTEQLNDRLRNCGNGDVTVLDNVAFSVAMSGTEARLYVCWKDDDSTYNMQCVETFCLQRPEHFLEFRKYVRNIIDWGKNVRLLWVQESLDMLLQTSQKIVSDSHAMLGTSSSDGTPSSSSRPTKRARR